MRIPRQLFLVIALAILLAENASAGTLTASFVPVNQGTNINLSADGALDWVHWGLLMDNSINRKTTVSPKIGDFTVIGKGSLHPTAYQYADNYNGFSWGDGFPNQGVTNTPTGEYVIGIDCGFTVSVPASTSLTTAKFYVGTFAARGKFEAFLSDGSATGYTNTSLTNLSNGPGAVYIISYAANSANQNLTIKWTTSSANRSDGNVTLQAVTLTSATANNPPFATMSSPSLNATFTAGSDIPLSADAFDADGSVAKVEFFDGATKLGESTNSPFAMTWSNAPTGFHRLTARVTDNGSASSSSSPLDIFVNTTGGSLSGSVSSSSSSVDLAAEGTMDWTHWGLTSSSSLDRKRGVATQISNFTEIGTHTVQRVTDYYTTWNWTDGTPTASSSSSTAIYISGYTNGFTFSVPASTNSQTLQVYVGLYGAAGNFQAYLSDFSAPAFTDTSLSSVYGDVAATYTINYAAASPGQSLNIRYTALNLFDWTFGNITLASATLFGGNLPPAVSIANPTAGQNFPAPANISIQANASDSDGSIAKVEFFNGTNKLGEILNSPYTFAANSLAAGTYSLAAKATDNLGSTFLSLPVQISVTAPTLVPMVNPQFSGQHLTFSFATQTNGQYIVRFTPSLNPIAWQTLTNVTGNGASAQITDPTPADATRFYQILSQ